MTKVLVIAMLAGAAFGQDSKSKGGAEQPDFYDQPTFVVSGVADYTYRGGHGSDTVLRSTEALTAATAALKNEPAGDSAGDQNEAKREHAKAEADEKRGDALDAVHEYQRAAELDATESNFFDLGTELLTHRAADAAIEVFTKANRLFPESVRTILGLAVSFYMRGDYDRAAQFFYKASDLRPEDPNPYLFLARVQSNSITESKEYLKKLARFAELQPNNAWANYYYAACLWKQRTGDGDSLVSNQVRELLTKAVGIDSKLGEGYLLLGVMDAEQKDLPHAITAYRQAIQAVPELAEAHYRLSQAYTQSGDGVQAHRELEVYRQLTSRSAEEAERERKEVQQFVVKLSAASH